MIHNEYSWQASDGIKLFAQSWSPEEEIKKVILIVHGHGDHSTRYDHWAERFVKNGYAVVGIDLRGHGKSGGKRGYISGYNNYLYDIELMINESVKLFSDKEFILYGQSMGGNLSVNYYIKKNPKVNAIIAASPWLRLVYLPTKFQLFLANVTKIILPKITQSTKLPVEDFSHDKYEIEKCKKDKLFHDKMSSILFLSVVEHGEIALAKADKINVPILLMHGSGDKITSHKATELFAEKIGDLATCKIWEGCYHELHHEFEREQIFESILNWINNL